MCIIDMKIMFDFEKIIFFEEYFNFVILLKMFKINSILNILYVFDFNFCVIIIELLRNKIKIKVIYFW